MTNIMDEPLQREVAISLINFIKVTMEKRIGVGGTKKYFLGEIIADPKWPTVKLYREQLIQFNEEYKMLLAFSSYVIGCKPEELTGLHMEAYLAGGLPLGEEDD